MHLKMQKNFYERYSSKSSKAGIMILLFATIITITKAAPDEISEEQVKEVNLIYHILRNSIRAASMRKKMDFNVHPCDNFYQFACGKYVQEKTIPDGQVSAGTFENLDVKLENNLRRIIPDGIKEDGPAVLKSMKTYHQTCMNTDKIEKSVEDLRKILKRLGGCPVLEGQSWDETNFDWTTSMYQSGEWGYSNDFFISVSVGIDPDNSSRHIIKIDQANTEIPHKNLITGKNNSIVQGYLQALIEVAKFLGTDRKVAENELGSVVDFEVDLAKISLSKDERRDKSKLNNRMTVQQLENNYTGIVWTEFLNEIIGRYAQVNQSEEIIVAVPSFLKNLPELIARTPKRVLANYVCARTIWESIDNMEERFLNTKIKAAKAYSSQNEEPRSKYCLKKVSDYFFTAVGWLYVRYYFDNNAKADVVSLMKYVRRSLDHLLEQADWMDSETKDVAINKLYSTVPHIGYPDEFDDDEKIKEVYKNLTLNSHSFLRAELNLKKFQKKEQYSNLREPVNKTNWIKHSKVAMVNAMYSFRENSFDLPAGILQEEFFSSDRPNYMNFAAIGSFIGHEMSHAFDNLGSQYDFYGNLINWWKTETREKYLERAKCFIEQFGNYTVKEVNMRINGVNTQGENIADNVGLKAAYHAYNYWTSFSGANEEQLPGLNYTSNQMFWISFASTWCAKYKPDFLARVLVFDPHATSEFRVIGTLSNIPEFSNDFKCPIGSPMNPVKKCSVW